MPTKSGAQVARLRTCIEEFAPGRCRTERLELFDKLRSKGAPRDTQRYGGDVSSYVLGIVVSGRSLFREVAASSKLNRRHYEGERRKLKNYTREVKAALQDNPLVRSVRLQVSLYGPEEIDCQHGYQRKHCETIHSALLFLSRRRVANANPTKRDKLLHLLRQRGIDTSRAPTDFCSPGQAVPKPKAPRRRTQPGRPRNDLRHFLVEEVMGCLVDAGETTEASAELLQRILSSCFDQHVEAEALTRQWTRVRKALDPLSASGLKNSRAEEAAAEQLRKRFLRNPEEAQQGRRPSRRSKRRQAAD